MKITICGTLMSIPFNTFSLASGNITVNLDGSRLNFDVLPHRNFSAF